MKSFRKSDTPFRKYLQTIGLTREALAKRAKLSDRTLHRLEHGLAEPKPMTIYALAENLGLTFEKMKELFPQLDLSGQSLKPREDPWRRRAAHSNLRAIREQRMMSRSELSRLTGISILTISRIEDKQQVTRMSTIRKILRSLDIPYSQVNEVFPKG